MDEGDGWLVGSVSVRLGATLWLLQPVYLIIELLVVNRVTAPYSLVDNTISDAGAAECTVINYAWGQFRCARH